MQIGKVDDFETIYTNKFRALASPYGIFLLYEKDRAALDIGMHFTQPKSDGSKIVTHSTAWFQLKGHLATTKSESQLKTMTSVSTPIPVSNLRLWYFLPQPVYLAVYLEALDKFIVIDAKRWIAENFATDLMSTKAKTVSIPIPIKNVLDDNVFRKMREAGQKPVVEKALKNDPKSSGIFFRDDQIIKRLATAKNQNTEMRITVVKYGSKTRTEVYFEERPIDAKEWTMVRSHWQFMMGSLQKAFPYLDFDPFEPEDYIGDMSSSGKFEPTDEYSWSYEGGLSYDEILILDDGRVISGKGEFERMEYELRPKLNSIGAEWAEILKTLETAEVMAVDENPMFVNVAPFAGFKL